MRVFLTVILTIVLSLTFAGCSEAVGGKGSNRNVDRRGAMDGMKTYNIGRFSIDVPKDFTLEALNQKIRYAEVSDFLWSKAEERQKQRNGIWANRISEIKKLPQPVDKSALIIEEREIQGIGKWAKAVIYRGDYLLPKRNFWSVLVDLGDVGVWLKIAGTNNDLMKKNFSNILTSYQVTKSQTKRNIFHLKHGSIHLPYLEQEQSYARFEGPMGMKLTLEMREIHKEPEEEGIIERTAAAMATGFAGGLEIRRIRARKRTAAGLGGEEEIILGDDGRTKNVSFDWEYLGKVESGTHPMIQISVDTVSDNLEEKIRIWDKILNSFQSAY